MASTYSNLKVELMGIGDQSGTWGTTNNTNLGTAIEEAVVGRANALFTADTDLTITLLNVNTTQVARNYILNVTSSVSLTATRNLIVPSINKPYIIENNTSGSQSIIVKTTAGTGVTVPTGKKAMVYADQTNVVQAFDYIPSATLGSLALTTALPIASGGTGQATANAALNAILPAQSASTFLKSDGANTAFATAVTSVAVSGGSTGLTFSGSPITGSGTITATGTLGTGNGGTGIAASGAAGNILASNGTSWGSVTLASASIAGINDTQTWGGYNGFGAANPQPTFWRMFIQANGANPGLVTYTATAGGAAQIAISSDTTAAFHSFYYGTPGSSVNVGSISTNGTTTAYTTTSDYRLKENVSGMSNALTRLGYLRPVRHSWKSNPAYGLVDGFIAHEVALIVPEAVTGSKDDLRIDGSVKPQGLDPSKLIPLLTAAIQEQQKIITSLTQRIAALEGAK